MDYFLFKHIYKPMYKEPKKLDDHYEGYEDYEIPFKDSFVLMYYCPKCKTRIWGLWEFPGEDIMCPYSDGEDNLLELYHDAFCYGNKESADTLKERYKYRSFKLRKDVFVLEEEKWKKEYNKALDVINSEEYKKIPEYRREVFKFFEHKNCPVCGADLTNEKPYCFDGGSFDEADFFEENAYIAVDYCYAFKKMKW